MKASALIENYLSISESDNDSIAAEKFVRILRDFLESIHKGQLNKIVVGSFIPLLDKRSRDGFLPAFTERDFYEWFGKVMPIVSQFVSRLSKKHNFTRDAAWVAFHLAAVDANIHQLNIVSAGRFEGLVAEKAAETLTGYSMRDLWKLYGDLFRNK